MKKVLTLMLAVVLGFSLSACTNEEDVANLADAVQKLNLDVDDVLSVTSDITLPTAGLHDAEVTWESSKPEVISNTGVVTRPAEGAGDVEVTLTATVKVGKETKTKEFKLKVLEMVPSKAVEIGFFNSNLAVIGEVYEITGVVTGTILGKGFHIADESGFTYVYEGKDATVKVGDNVTVLGAKKVYFNVIEVVDVQSVKVNSSDNALPEYEPTTIADIYGNNPERSSIYNKMISFSGFVGLQGAHNNVYLSWYDADLNLQQVEVYYKSGSAEKIAEVAALEGKLVDLSAIFMDYYSSAPAHYRVSVNGHDTVAEKAALTNEEKAKLTVAFADLNIMSTTGIDYNLTLPTTNAYTGVDMVWTSSNEAVISTDGTVTQTLGQDEAVTLTVTATVGEGDDAYTATKTYEVTVLDASKSVPLTVGEALAKADDEAVLLQGIVTGFNYKGYPLIQDAEGNGILVWGTTYEGKVGDEIVMRGTLSSYSGLRQLADATFVKLVKEDAELPVNTTITAAELVDLTNFANTQNKLYTIELTIGTLEDGSYTQFVGDGTNTISLFTNGHFIRDMYQDGDKVTLTFFISGKGDTNVKIELQAVELSDEEKLAIVENEIEVSGDTAVDLTLVTEVSEYNATITWTSDNAAVTAEGVVTRPAIGEANVTVTLTASIVIGDAAAVTKTFTVTVLAQVENTSGWDNRDDFSTYEGSSSYETKTFTGDSNVSWDVVGVRKDLGGYQIDEIGGVMTKTGNMTAAVVNGGISKISLDLKAAFTGGTAADRTVEIYVNDVLVGTYTLTTMDTVENITIDNINVAGDFKLEIRSAGERQIIFDNLQWNGFTE
jgi:hypothetical protein